MTPKPFSALTIASTGGLLRVIACDCHIARAFDTATTHPAQQPAFKKFNAIWDTGATSCAITQRVVDECGLKPHRMQEVHHGGGTDVCEVYAVNIRLPNGVGVQQVEAMKLNVDGADLLIGMDIMTLGDVTISNANNRTVFSFRMPSLGTVDFVAQSKQHAASPPAKRHTRRSKRH